MKHAIRRGLLRDNPLPKGKEAKAVTRTSYAVDKRCLLNADQAPALLGHVWKRSRGGKRLHAFFATLYYCGPRPEEAVAMRVADVKLPGSDAADQWSELVIHSATPEVGKQWTDKGDIHERRDLKGRAEGETRTVPGHPALTRILRQHIEDAQLKPGLLFQGRTAASSRDPSSAGPGAALGKPCCHRTSSTRRRAGGSTTIATHASPSGSTAEYRPLRSPSGPATACPCCWPPTPGASTGSCLT
ncbi:hypothetical protein [Streptomyces sp. 11x1]|uniref:hypothetical protein n=1 Tax=Streptomyces sp. 11x1 TaxID=3038642 RepID=UPI00292CED96|nr:hypothetical protein [Streptomyces sp. 11x1]WNZ11372.1 hypothetical protein P8T65_30030 [Streptomyces sp. 11x1]